MTPTARREIRRAISAIQFPREIDRCPDTEGCNNVIPLDNIKITMDEPKALFHATAICTNCNRVWTVPFRHFAGVAVIAGKVEEVKDAKRITGMKALVEHRTRKYKAMSA
jgi:hypothetical protein